MCKWGTHTLVSVKIPVDLACSGEQYWKQMKIDSCIASIVEALQRGGIDMRGSCCGHGKGLGDINLQDGRTLLILSEEHALQFSVKAGDEDAQIAVLVAALRGEPVP